MDAPLPTLLPFIVIGYVAGALAYLYIALGKGRAEHAWLAAVLCGAFLGFTLVTAWAEGPIAFVFFQAETLWGVQVFWDLVIAGGIALLLAAPRARAVGMNVLPYMLLTGALGSIGLLAMVARLFWLEQRGTAAGASAAPDATPPTT